MQRSLFLSSISVVALAFLGGCPGDDDACGPGNAQDAGLLASSADVVLNYTNLTSGPNNDCPDGTAPDGVISLTIQGNQLEGPGLLTLCIPRPDLLEAGPLQLGTQVRIINLNGAVDGCEYEFEQLRPVAGQVTTTGFCDAGTNLDGYALTVDGSLSLSRVCPTMSDTIAVSFSGTVSVVATP